MFRFLKLGFVLGLSVLCGCAGYRLSHLHGVVEGNSLSTPVGPASGNIEYDSWTCMGNCPKYFDLNCVTNK